MKLEKQDNAAEYVYVTLKCRDCEQDNCVFMPLGRFIYNKEGCTRKVSEEVAARFSYYSKDVIPFGFQYDMSYIKNSYKEIIDFLFKEIYSAPIGQRLDPDGKVRLSGY